MVGRLDLVLAELMHVAQERGRDRKVPASLLLSWGKLMKTRMMLLAPLLLLGCARSDPPRAAVVVSAATPDTAHPWRKPGDKVDSILPMREYLRRFRIGLAETAGLTGGESNRVALARKFLAEVGSRDTSGMDGLLISRAEFGWVVFPEHRYFSPPYELDPDILWLQLVAETAKGRERVLQRYGGRELAFRSLTCQRDTLQVRSETIRIWSPCRVVFRAGDSTETHRLFGSIVERDGRVKLLSIANDF